MPPADTFGAIALAEVALLASQGGAEALYTYAAPFPVRRGDAVLAPLGTRTVLGFVREVHNGEPENADRLRPLIERIEGASLPESVVDLVEFIAHEYICPFPVALAAAAPPKAQEGLIEAWEPIDSADKNLHLTPTQRETWATVCESKTILRSKARKLAPSTLRALRALEKMGLVRRSTRFESGIRTDSAERFYRPAPDADAVDAYLSLHSRKRPAQAVVLIKLREMDDTALTTADIKGLCGVTDTTVRQLVSAGMLVEATEATPNSYIPPTPSREQTIAIEAISEAIEERESKSFLLFGVTGSGKTEVYMRCAAEAVRLGRQVLYLVPEIALATQAVKHLRDRFGRSVAILHSELPASERCANWERVRSGGAAIVLGARSALFSPLRDVGLIVVDEEHESSYKQDSAPRYHAKQAAMYLSRRHGCPLVLGSATPSFETFFEAEHGKHTLLTLPNRAASARLPEVFIEDLSSGYRTSQPSLLTEALRARLEAVLERGEQAILFLNRRAYAPFSMCRDCGHTFSCPNCAVSLTYSRKSNRLRCHHCGFTAKPSDICPSCGGNRLGAFGVGAERVEEFVAETFPNAKVARLDRDVAQRKGAVEAVLAAFGSGETDILVGTQMVAKGLDFPGVTLVGVIAADLSLNLPDFRAAERTFQLLSQVAGRAGRGQKPGEVVIQTFNPDHFSIDSARTHRYIDAYEALMGERREAGYPPFTRLTNVVFSGPDKGRVQRAAEAFAQVWHANEPPETSMLGPTECAIERLNQQWRLHALVKAENETHGGFVRECVAAAQSDGVHIVIDVDPYSMF